MPGVVDADTHIIEPLAMWDKFDKELWDRRPVAVVAPTDTLYKQSNAFWIIDGEMFPKPAGKGSFALHTPSLAAREVARTDIEIGIRDLSDPEARVRDMDRRGVDIEIVYPTLFIVYLTDDPDLDTALCRSYNRYLAEAWAKGEGRLRWIAVLPLRSINNSVKEMQFAKEHGAVGILFRGVEGDKSLADPYFFPVYEEASRLNLPLCVHTGAGSPAITSAFDIRLSSTFPHVRLQPLIAFRDLVANKIPEQFPDLRIGFLEAASSWVPFLLHILTRTFKNTAIRIGSNGPGFIGEESWGKQLFEDYHLWVACEADEDIPYLLNFIGEDHLLIGSDFGHLDQSFENGMVQTMRGREDLPSRVTEKILCENPRAFYGL